MALTTQQQEAIAALTAASLASNPLFAALQQALANQANVQTQYNTILAGYQTTYNNAVAALNVKAAPYFATAAADVAAAQAAIDAAAPANPAPTNGTLS